MLHVVAHALPGEFLWRSHEEALALWTRLLVLRPAALCLMPDHLHSMTEHYDRARFVRILSGYARWRHHHRGDPGGQVWLPHPEPRGLSGALHLRRSFRYVGLNPCRDGLAEDPLAWAWSAYRDAVGLAWPPVVRTVRRPDELHAYVSADPSVDVNGTALPWPRADGGRPRWRELVAAVSALTRTPAGRLGKAGPGRQLLITTARQLGGLSIRAIASNLGVSSSTVQREAAGAPHLVSLVERVLGDLCFRGLHRGRLDHERRWRRYMDGQGRRRRRSGWLFA